MAHPTVVPFDISKLLFLVKEQKQGIFGHILKQRCLLKDELKTHGQTLM